MDAIEVGVLGATGVVGQQFVSRLERHPWFRLTWLAASERSQGKPYREVAPWKLAAPMPGRSRLDRWDGHAAQRAVTSLRRRAAPAR